MRSKIDANKAAFSNLISEFAKISELAVEHGKRYIQTDDIEKRWLIESKILQSFKVSPSILCLDIILDDVRFIAIIGPKLSASKLDTKVLFESPVNAGLQTVLLAENYLSLNENISPLSFYNEILFQHKDSEYKGHDFNDLTPYLDVINLFEIPSDSVLRIFSLERIISYILSSEDVVHVLNFEKETLDVFSGIALSSPDKLSFESIINALLSSNYKHAFLELYRLIERLFPLNYLKELHEEVKTTLTFLEFAASVENVTSWRPKEEEAVEKLFIDSKQSVRDSFDNFLETMPAYKGITNHKYFYKLRNTIVHFRANHEEMLLTDANWNSLLRATLGMIDHQYSKNSSFL